MKKWLKIVLIGLVALVALAIVGIELNKERILKTAVSAINDNITGQITYQDADVSLFRSFPQLRVSMYDAVVQHADEGLPTLANIGTFYVDLDIPPLIKSRDNIVINSLSIEHADIQAFTQRDGASNFALAKEASDNRSSVSTNFEIKNFSVENTKLRWVDQQSATSLALEDIALQSNVKSQDNSYLLKSELSADLIASISNILPHYKVSIKSNNDIRLSHDFENADLTTDELLINDMPIKLSGKVDDLSGVGSYQLQFASPETAIKKLISLIPAIYTNEYTRLISSGSYKLDGSVQGKLSDAFPQYQINIIANEGTFQLPQTGNTSNKISFELKAKNDHPNRPYSTVDIKHLDFASGDSKAIGDLLVQATGSSQTISADMNTQLNLAEITANMIPESGYQSSGQISGIIKGDATLRHGQLEKVGSKDFTIDLQATDVSVQGNNQNISLPRATLIGNAQSANISGTDIVINDLFKGGISGSITQPLAFAFEENAPLEGDLVIHAKEINLLTTNAQQDTVQRAGWEVPANNLKLDLTAEKVSYGEYVFEGAKGSGSIVNDKSEFQFTTDNFRGSRIHGNAKMNNILNYTFNNELLDGTVNLRTDKIILDEFMMSDTITATPTNEILNIPKNINLTIDYNSDAISFKNIDVANGLGAINIKDQKIVFKSDGKILGGQLAVVGQLKPEVDGYDLGLSLDLSNLQLGETAKTIKLFSKIVPVAKLLEGVYSTNMKWSSKLDANYIPDLNSLTASGSFETQDGQIAGSLPIDTFFRKLVKTQERKPLIKLDNGKKYFAIKDGKVLVKNLILRRDGYKFKMEGTHGFNQEVDYNIYFDIPKSELNANEILDFVTTTVKFNDLIKNASDKLKVQVVAGMTGSVMHPKFAIKSINLKNGNVVENITDQVVATAEAAKDSIITEINNKKDSIEAEITETVDSLKTEGQEIIDSVTTELTSVVDTTIASLENIIRQEEESIKREGASILDSLKAGNIEDLGEQLEDILTGRAGILDSLGGLDSLLRLDSMKVNVPKGLLDKPKGLLQRLKDNE